MHDYPSPLVRIGHIEPVPRRVRATKDDQVVIDTKHAKYVFEWAFYPQFYIPLGDVQVELTATGRTEQSHSGTVEWHDLDTVERAARVVTDGPLDGHVRFDWDALDHWYEEDEEIFVHPRNPYVRVDALRSSRHVRIETDGVLLAESDAPVLVFETGLPTRFYLDKTAVRFECLVENGLRTACPYKGRTTGYWSTTGGIADVAWCYEFPTHQLLPIAGLVGFLNERLDLTLDGAPLERPRTHFS